MDYVSSKFELIAYCSDDSFTSQAILGHIEAKKKYFEYRFYSRHALFANPNLCVKYFDFLLDENRTLENVIMVDSNISSFSLHTFNGIPIKPYIGEKTTDKELAHLAKYLTELEHEESIHLTLGTMIRGAILLAQYSKNCGLRSSE